MKPLCELCGDRHEKHQAHKFRTVSNVAPVSNPVSNAGSPDYLRVKLWRQANRDKYNAGQRELMRRKRAK